MDGRLLKTILFQGAKNKCLSKWCHSGCVSSYLVLWYWSVFKFCSSTNDLRFPLWKGLINLAMADTQEIFKQHLIKDEVQTNFWKDILHISVNYKLCSFLHELSNPSDRRQPVLILGVLCFISLKSLVTYSRYGI